MMSAAGLIHQLQIGGLLNEVHKVVGQRDENFINLPGGKVSYHEKPGCSKPQIRLGCKLGR